MKKVLKRSLSIFLAITIIFSSVYAGFNELDFSGFFAVKANAISYVGVSGHTIVDSITFNGVTTEAVYTNYYGSGYNSDTTYCCAAFVKRFFSNSYGINVWNLTYQQTPLANDGSFSVTTSPKVGDIVRRNSKTHWMIVKAVSGTTVTLIEQNWWDSPYSQAPVNRTISTTNSDYTFFRYSKATDGGVSSNTPSETTPPQITNVTVQNADNGYLVSCNVSDNVGVTEVSFPSWTDSNGQDDLIWHKGTLSADGKSAYCWIYTADHNNEAGYYVTHIYAYDASGNSTNVAVPYVNVVNVMQSPVFSEVKVSQVAENGYNVTAKVSDNVGVTKVVFPTWIPGQTVDDIIWLQGSYNSTYGYWECWVPVSDWDNHYGTYYTHIYAYDAAGNNTCYEMPDIRVPKVTSCSEALASSGTYDLRTQKTIYVAGWAYNKNGDSVKLYYRLDGGTWIEFDLIERANVQNSYSDCMQLKCGYDKNISISHLSAGQHTIDVIVSTNGMTKVIASSNFTVTRPDSYVYFDANGGSGVPSKQTKTYGQTLILSSTIPIRSGYTFLGWSTSNTATVATYSAGDSFTIDADTTLYAVWLKNHSHNYSETVTKAPTCTESGEKMFTCSCGESYTESIDALGHDYSTEWIIDVEETCTESGSKSHHCSVCDDKTDITVIAATGHNYEIINVVSGHPHTTSYKCSYCGNEKTERLASSTCIECNFTITFIDSTDYKLVSYIGLETEVVIPAEYEDSAVTTIANSCFKGNTEITSVEIEEGVTTIGSLAFMNCTSLQKVVIPASVTSIGTQSFYGFTGIIYCEYGSIAHKYAIDNKINYVINSTDEPEEPIQETVNTQIDYENFVIRTSAYACKDINEILGLSESAVAVAEASYIHGNLELYGTGTVITVFDGNEYIGDFTLVVEGDTNGDSVCDVLDASQVALVSNGHRTLDGAYAMAADSNSDDIVDVNDYQSIVNKAVA